MKYLLQFLLVLLPFSGFTQQKNSNNPLKGDSSLNEHLFYYFKKNINLEQYDSLCIESCAFVKFTVQKNTITGIQCSKSTPLFLQHILAKALQATTGLWKTTRKPVVYLLPVVYIFERNCLPQNNTTTTILQLLQDLSAKSGKNHFLGFGTDSPLTCNILNPFFIKSHYE